jgi:hypothetical protein
MMMRLRMIISPEMSRKVDEIRAFVAQHSWHFQPVKSGGFVIFGHTYGGLKWTLRTTDVHARGQAKFAMQLTYPDAGGAFDVAILPRNNKFPPEQLPFLEASQKVPTGVASFDERYDALRTPGNGGLVPLDSELARRFLKWPNQALNPLALWAWRDPEGCHLVASMTAMPDWNTTRYLIAIGEDFCARLPAPALSSMRARTAASA